MKLRRKPTGKHGFRLIYHGKVRAGDYGRRKGWARWVELRPCYVGMNINELEFEVARKYE